MDMTQIGRDRLLVRATQILVGAALGSALIVLSMPGSAATTAYWLALPLLALPLLALAALATIRLARPPWALAYTGLLLLAAAAATLLALLQPGPATVDAVVLLLAVAAPSASLLLLSMPGGALPYWGIGAITIALGGLLLGPAETDDPWFLPLLMTASGWLVACLGGLVLVRLPALVRAQIDEIGHAHLAERQASELELGRRRNARLLHDTVLATLTLLAHSGVGVSGEALRSQARSDAHLLRQLRLGEPLHALPETPYAPEPVEESTLGTTLESVRERFDGLGLAVAWHGASRIALPQPRLDAFLFSISESLENVRRHAGVSSAHVTITETATKVSAMITDAGKGFLPEEISAQRLGLKESVIARLAEVGGTAKVFSAPGAGTTVLLEVPR